MLTRTLFSSVAMAFLVTMAHGAAAQDLRSQLIGVWKLTSFVQKEMATGATTNLRGEKPAGSAIFTAGGHFTWIIVDEGRKAPTGPLNDADRIMLFRTSAFGSGTYKVEGSSVPLYYHTSSNQAWTGTERSSEMKVTGKTLTWTSASYKNQDGKGAAAIFTMERVE